MPGNRKCHMHFRRIGDTELDCSIIGLGTGRLASVSGGVSRAQATRLLGVAEDCGINLIDTANSYAQGGCEKMIGAAWKGKRSKFIVITKAGYCFSALGGGLKLLKPLAKRALKFFKGGRELSGSVRGSVSRQNFNPGTIRNDVVNSLLRLGTDYVDVFLLHSPTQEAMADRELFEMLRQLKREGKIRHFGVSSPDSVVLERALSVAGLTVVQTPVNPVQTGDHSLLARFQSAKIGVVANQIFLSGKLLGTSDAEGDVSRAKAGLESLAAVKGISLNHLLIQNVLAQPGVVSALTGTTNIEHLKQNVSDALAGSVVSVEEVTTALRGEASRF